MAAYAWRISAEQSATSWSVSVERVIVRGKYSTLQAPAVLWNK